MTPSPHLRSLSEALLYGHIGEDTRELLDGSRVDLRAEGDVQEEELWTGLEELLQGGGTHQAGPCQHKTSHVTEGVWPKHDHERPHTHLRLQCSLTRSYSVRIEFRPHPECRGAAVRDSR